MKLKDLLFNSPRQEVKKQEVAGPNYVYHPGYSGWDGRWFVSRSTETVDSVVGKIINAAKNTTPEHRINGDIVEESEFGFLLNFRLSPRYPTFNEFFKFMASSYYKYGNAYALIVRHKQYGVGSSSIKRLEPIQAGKVREVSQDKDTGEILYTVEGFDKKINARDMVHVKKDTSKGLISRSVYDEIATIVDLEKAVNEALITKVDDVKLPMAAVFEGQQFGFDADAIRLVREAIDESMQPWLRGESPIVLSDTFDLREIEIDPQYFNYAEIDRAIKSKVANYFDIPFALLDSTGGFDGYDEVYQSFVKQTIIPLLGDFETELTNKLLSSKEIKDGQRIEFNYLTLNDTERTVKTIKELRTLGIISANEARELLSMGEMEENGDLYLVSSDLIPLENTKSSYRGKMQTRGDTEIEQEK